MDKALLVIDIQDSFKYSPQRWATRNNPAFEENVTALIDAFREASLPRAGVSARQLRRMKRS